MNTIEKAYLEKEGQWRQADGMRNMTEEEMLRHYQAMYPKGLSWAMRNRYAPKPKPELPWEDVQ